MKYTSRELNKKLEALSNRKDIYSVCGVGKAIPYIGWFWREVMFDNVTLCLGDCGEFIGFMENNKWGYDYVEVNKENSDKLKDMLCNIVDNPTTNSLHELFLFIQSLRSIKDIESTICSLKDEKRDIEQQINAYEKRMRI